MQIGHLEQDLKYGFTVVIPIYSYDNLGLSHQEKFDEILKTATGTVNCLDRVIDLLWPIEGSLRVDQVEGYVKLAVYGGPMKLISELGRFNYSFIGTRTCPSDIPELSTVQIKGPYQIAKVYEQYLATFMSYQGLAGKNPIIRKDLWLFSLLYVWILWKYQDD